MGLVGINTIGSTAWNSEMSYPNWNIYSTNYSFKYQVDSKCPLCHMEDEDITHMLLRCSVLHSVRKEPFILLKDYVISRTNTVFWRKVFPTKVHVVSLVKLIIDCGQVAELHSVQNIDLTHIERLSRNLCFAIHAERLKKLNEG